MRVASIISAPILSLSLAFAAYAEPAVPIQSAGVPNYLSTYVVDPEINCIFQGAAVQKSPNTDLLLKIGKEAAHLTDMGDYLSRYTQQAEYPVCMTDDPVNMGTSRNIQYMKEGQHHISTYSTISSDRSVYPKGLTEDEMLSYRVLGFLEESAHALNAVGLQMNTGYEMQLYAGLFSPKEVVKGVWANEALASTAALIALRQQAENGYDKHWNVIKNFPSYSNITKAIDKAATDDPKSLFDGRAHIAGFAAWYDTPHLKYLYAKRIISGYEKILDVHISRNFPVDIQDFKPINVVHMAAGLNAHQAFKDRPSLVHLAVSERMFNQLHPDLIEQVKQLEVGVRMYKVDRNQTQVAFTNNN